MSKIARFDCFEVDFASGKLRKHGIRIPLREQPFQALALLLERPGEVVTRDDLRWRLWPTDVFVDFENNLNNVIARLREALGDSADRPRFVETLPKRGYRFIAPVLDASVPPAQSQTPRARLLVLPFLNLSSDTGQEYFSDGMTEEVITALAALAPGQLGVIARTTAMRYRSTPKDIGQIGRELHVDYIVEGSVRRQQDRLTIIVQLIRASDQTHVFARRYEADLDGVFGLRNAIAETIAGQIGIAPHPCPGTRARRTPTTDVTAYHLYLRARALLSQETPESFPTTKQYLLDAVARDPRFALAYDALAELHWYVGFMGLAPSKEVAAVAMSYAIQALNIDDTLAETHALLGILLKEVDLDWDAVKREIDRAREIDPTSPLVRLRYAIGWLLPELRFAEAALELEAAIESDPQSTLLRAWLVCVRWLNREYERAIEQARLIVAFDPAAFTGYWMLGMVLREAGRFDEAIAAHHAAVERSGGSPLLLGWLGLALGQAGHGAEARALLERLQGIAATQYVPPTAFAWTHYGLGDIDAAFVWMDRAIDVRDDMIFPIGAYPFLDPLRSDPRYIALLKKLNYDPAGNGVRRPVAAAPPPGL
jgi:TolB-like protein/tetratricopeptide (TPR) repeat protein